MNPLLAASARDLAGASPATDAIAGAANVSTIDPEYRAKATKAAEKFEGFMIGEMLRGMRRSTKQLASEDSPFKNPVNDDMMDMADTLLADSMAGQHAFGIADALLRQILPGEPVKTPLVSPKK
jgi:flagellar protein FlgJ